MKHEKHDPNRKGWEDQYLAAKQALAIWAVLAVLGVTGFVYLLGLLFGCD